MSFLFEENQKFTQWWLWLILLYFPFSALFIYNTPLNYTYVLIGFAIPLIFYLFQLRIKVDKNGLHYQFFPLHFKSHTINIDEIEKIEALEYKPISEYGGWGIKYGFQGKCYNVSGNKGVKVFLKNGTNILFGSQRHVELEKALKNIKKQ
tara:strand:+ start:710 stop:1159 length:450 start_codon:yes stop_codon:yes gene_type:complete